jgi:protein phosphatase
LNQNNQLALLIVADGMGGHAGGDQAARLALRTIGTVLTPILTGALSTAQREVTRAGLTGSIDSAIKEANRVVRQSAASDRRCKGMGATAAIVVIWNGRVMIGHVGDCRVYYHHAARLKPVTRDQTLVNRMVELGQLTKAEAAAHPASNEVLQAIGSRSNIEPAHYKLKLISGDWLLVTCDGLHGQVDDPTIETTLNKAPPSAPLLAARLVDMADQSGGADNCTVVAVRCY